MIKQLDSKIVYQNKWMTVREDKIERPSGAQGIYGVVDKPDCAVIIAIDKGQVHLVQQYRYTVQQRCWELPQGAWENNPDADHLSLAKGSYVKKPACQRKAWCMSVPNISHTDFSTRPVTFTSPRS